MSSAAGALAVAVTLGAVVDALGVGGRALVVRDGLGKLGGVGGLIVGADAGVHESSLIWSAFHVTEWMSTDSLRHNYSVSACHWPRGSGDRSGGTMSFGLYTTGLEGYQHYIGS